MDLDNAKSFSIYGGILFGFISVVVLVLATKDYERNLKKHSKNTWDYIGAWKARRETFIKNWWIVPIMLLAAIFTVLTFLLDRV